MIKAEIVAHSLSPQGDELITVLCTFPRIILAEVNTHRMLSKNTSSSRAIKFEKMVEAIEDNPFIPIAFQKEHTGMQGFEYLEYVAADQALTEWLRTKDIIIKEAKILNGNNVTKQLCNRLLEPFMWTTMLITGSREGWDNFFNLRCPQYEIVFNTEPKTKEIFKSWKDTCDRTKVKEMKTASILKKLQINKGQAEIHMMALAECIWDSVNESTPKQLKAGEWHIPFEDKIGIEDYLQEYINKNPSESYRAYELEGIFKTKVSTAMAAHTSYTTVGNEPIKSYEKWIELHDKLIAYEPPHSSPMEHCAKAMNDDEYERFIKGYIKDFYLDGVEGKTLDKDINGWCYNLKGFIPYRYIIDNNIKL